MIEEQAKVIGVDGSRAVLEIERSQPCGLCGSTQGCGVSLWGRFFSGRKSRLSAENSLNLQAGESVIIGMQEGGLLGSALIVYAPPLLLLCLGAWGSMSLAGDSGAMRDLYASTGALLGLVAGLWLVRFLAARNRQLGRFQPVMLRRAEGQTSRSCSKKFQ